MSFLDETKKKAEEATNKASEEVKEAAEDVKEFGAKAVEEIKEFGANAVDKAKEVGDKASEEIKEAAGERMSFCTNCGKKLDTESNFCPKCGVRTDNGVKAGVAIPWASDPHWRQEMDVALQKASKAIDEGVKIVRETFREVAGEVEKGVNQARTSMKEGPVRCENCGQDNAKFAKFCSKCGKEL